MLTIGLVGGVASGKSAVSAALARRGAVVFDADKIGHRVLDEPDTRDELVDRWGTSILDAAGRISRDAVAERVFGNSPEAAAERQFLEQTLHPRIRQRILSDIAALPDQGTPAVVIDAPLLLESGWDNACNAVVMVEAPVAIRRQRALARGWTPAEFTRREAAQLPIEEKRARATHTLDNSGSLADLDQQVSGLWAAIVG
jgi:dephospho-CoA kinase